MKVASLSVLIASGLWLGAAPPAPAAEPYNDIGVAKFACVSGNAEDSVAIPGSDCLVVSGVMRAVNVKDHTEVNLFTATSKHDKKLYGVCPGPITGKEIEEKKIRAHGVNVREGQGGVHTLYVVHHGERESIEVFEHADNIKWQPDGTLVTAGQTGTVDEMLEECLANQRCTKTASSVAIIDPASGKVREVVTGYPSNGDFDLATAALLANKEVWVGSIGRGIRIGRLPSP